MSKRKCENCDPSEENIHDNVEKAFNLFLNLVQIGSIFKFKKY